MKGSLKVKAEIGDREPVSMELSVKVKSAIAVSMVKPKV